MCHLANILYDMILTGFPPTSLAKGHVWSKDKEALI